MRGLLGSPREPNVKSNPTLSVQCRWVTNVLRVISVQGYVWGYVETVG